MQFLLVRPTAGCQAVLQLCGAACTKDHQGGVELIWYKAPSPLHERSGLNNLEPDPHIVPSVETSCQGVTA